MAARDAAGNVNKFQETHQSFEMRKSWPRLNFGNLNLGGGWPLVWWSETLESGFGAFPTFGIWWQCWLHHLALITLENSSFSNRAVVTRCLEQKEERLPQWYESAGKEQVSAQQKSLPGAASSKGGILTLSSL